MRTKKLLIAYIIVLFATIKISNGQVTDKKIDPTFTKIDSSKFATMYVYRKNKHNGRLNWYDLKMDDTEMKGKVITKIKNNSTYFIRLYREGPTTFWAKEENTSTVTVNVKFGRTYYMRCGISMGVLAPRPRLRIINNPLGKAEYDQIRKNLN